MTLVKQGNFPVSWDTLLLLVLAMAHLYFNPVSSALVVSLLALYVLLGFAFPHMGDEVLEAVGEA